MDLRVGSFLQNHYLFHLLSFNPLILETLSQQFYLFKQSILSLRERKNPPNLRCKQLKKFLGLDKSRVVKTEV